MVLSVEILRHKMSWSLGTCFVVSSSALQQRAQEKLFNRLWLSFPLGKLRSQHCPSWCWGSELNIAQGMHVRSCQEPLWEEGAAVGCLHGTRSSREPGWRVLLHPRFAVGV